MNLATIVIPVAPKHYATGIYTEAVASANAQTIPCDVIVEVDHDRTGAAATRNRAMRKVTTPFVVWLDADDLIKPNFVEECLNVYETGTYVYTDWVINGLVINTPDCLNMWDVGQEHVITTLMPTSAWEAVGGFDETIDTLEDEDYHRKLHAFGWCGVRCPEPLITYRRHFGTSLVNKDLIDKDLQEKRVAEKHALFNNRYRRYKHMATQSCSKCGTPTAPIRSNPGEKPQPNDVLVETLYSPQRIEGAITRRLYPRIGIGKPLWVDIDDAQSRPDLFRIIAKRPEKIAPDAKKVRELAVQAIEREAQSVIVNHYDEMTRAELLEVAESQGMNIEGTGARGRVLREDLIRALA